MKKNSEKIVPISEETIVKADKLESLIHLSNDIREKERRMPISFNEFLFQASTNMDCVFRDIFQVFHKHILLLLARVKILLFERYGQIHLLNRGGIARVSFPISSVGDPQKQVLVSFIPVGDCENLYPFNVFSRRQTHEHIAFTLTAIGVLTIWKKHDPIISLDIRFLILLTFLAQSLNSCADRVVQGGIALGE